MTESSGPFRSHRVSGTGRGRNPVAISGGSAGGTGMGRRLLVNGDAFSSRLGDDGGARRGRGVLGGRIGKGSLPESRPLERWLVRLRGGGELFAGYRCSIGAKGLLGCRRTCPVRRRPLGPRGRRFGIREGGGAAGTRRWGRLVRGGRTAGLCRGA